MSAYKFFISQLNEKIKQRSQSEAKEDKILHKNDIHVKNSLIILGEEVFNSHMKSTLEYSLKKTDESNENFDFFYGDIAHNFHKCFRQYDVSEKFKDEKYKTYINYGSKSNPDVVNEEYNVDGRIDTIIWNSFAIHSEFWDVFHQYATEQYNERKAA